MISRRSLLAALSTAFVATPFPAPAQTPPKMHRIGFLGPGSASGYVREIEAIRAGLRDLGYVEGKNITVEYRWADGNMDRLKSMAAELVALKVDVLITYATVGVRAAMQTTKTVPIVVADAIDPVAQGFIKSYAHPGGNVTGSTSFQGEIQAKRLQLLKEAAPRVNRAAFLVNALNPGGFALFRKSLEEGARLTKVDLQEFPVREGADLPEAFNAMAKAKVDGVVVAEDSLFVSNAGIIAALALTHKIPASGFTHFADAGALLGYGANRSALFGRAGYFVDRILKGAKPGDLPYERATQFELIVNMKTAKALGLTIPASIMVRTDRVIQ
jgi:putative ABC transport system substrate-binding protein